MDSFDAIVLGAGQAGGPLSTACAKAGWKTALVERRYVGGTCVNVGCTPTKTMVASASAAEMARRAAEYGVHVENVFVDLRLVHERKEKIVQDFRASSLRRIEQAGVELIHGQAAFSGPKVISITPEQGSPRQITAPRIFINAGARPQVPALEGLNTVPYLDSTSVMELERVPESLLILGGGYVALEFGQMFRRFGSRVTILQRGEQLLDREDADVAEAVLKILQEDGIEVVLRANVRKVERGKGGALCLTVDTPEAAGRVLEGSHLLVAAGRVPNSDSLNLAATGVRTDARGLIQVNDHLETNVEGIYALGDIKGGPAFTHISYDDYRILKTNLLDGGKASTTGRMVPYTVFINPQLGRVGLSEKEAREKGYAVQVASMPMEYVSRALETGQSRGMMKVMVDGKTQQILGAAVLGMEGGELMAMLEIAMMGHLPYTALRDGIFAHPTLAEGFNNLFASL